MKINIGCGNDILPGFMNIDIADIVIPVMDVQTSIHQMDVMDLDKHFAAGCAKEIVANHFFEHLSHEQITILLYKLWKILKPGGRLTLRVPDFYGILEHHRKLHESRMFGTLDVLHSRIFAAEEEHSHRSVWTAEIARHYLTREGFFRIIDITQTGALDFEICIFAKKERMKNAN